MGELLFTLLQLWYIVERCECDVYPFWMLRVLVQPWPAILFVMRNLLNDECSNWKMYNDVTLSFFVRYIALDPSRKKRLTGYGSVLAAPAFFTTQNFLGKKKKKTCTTNTGFLLCPFCFGLRSLKFGNPFFNVTYGRKLILGSTT